MLSTEGQRALQIGAAAGCAALDACPHILPFHKELADAVLPRHVYRRRRSPRVT